MSIDQSIANRGICRVLPKTVAGIRVHARIFGSKVQQLKIALIKQKIKVEKWK